MSADIIQQTGVSKPSPEIRYKIQALWILGVALTRSSKVQLNTMLQLHKLQSSLLHGGDPHFAPNHRLNATSR